MYLTHDSQKGYIVIVTHVSYTICCLQIKNNCKESLRLKKTDCILGAKGNDWNKK